MHSLAVLTTLFAASAIAGPFHNKHAALHKRNPVEVDIVNTVVDWEVDTVTVTAGQGPTSTVPATTSKAAVEGEAYGTGIPKKEWTIPDKQAGHKKPVKAVTYISPSPLPSSSATPSSTYAPVHSSSASSSSSSAAEAASTPASSGSSGSYQDTMTSKHKTLRATFGHGALVWNDTLASLAEYQAKAANCKMAHNLNDQNGQPVAIGQNLAAGSDGDGPNGNWDKVSGQIQSWYDEKDGYSSISDNFQSPPSDSAMASGTAGGKEILHFSQLVWKASEQVGCYTVTGCPPMIAGAAVTSLTFCNYYPAGNIANENDSNQYQSYLENVGQPASGN